MCQVVDLECQFVAIDRLCVRLSKQSSIQNEHIQSSASIYIVHTLLVMHNQSLTAAAAEERNMVDNVPVFQFEVVGKLLNLAQG